MTSLIPAWTLIDWLTLAAAIPAGVGGCLLGVRGADAINRRLGRAAPADKPEPAREVE